MKTRSASYNTPGSFAGYGTLNIISSFLQQAGMKTLFACWSCLVEELVTGRKLNIEMVLISIALQLSLTKERHCANSLMPRYKTS